MIARPKPSLQPTGYGRLRRPWPAGELKRYTARLTYLHSVAFFVMALVGSSAMSQPAVVVPFEIVRNFPVVQVQIGDQLVPLLFDLGADDVALSTDVARSLQVQLLAETYTLLDVYGKKIEGHKFVIPRMEIGSLEFHDVKGTEFAKAPVGSGHIGVELVKAFRLVLNYKEKTMTLIAPDEPDPARHGCYGTEVSFEHGWAATKAATDWGELVLVWDTGAPMNVIREGVVKARGIEAGDPTIQSGRFLLGGTEFGPVRFRSVDFEQPPGVDGFVGYDFFANHIVCIDFRSERFLIRTNE